MRGLREDDLWNAVGLFTRGQISYVTIFSYDPFVPVLVEARHRARGLTADYNNLDTKAVPSDKIAPVRLDMLRKFVGKVGDGTFVEPPFLPDYGCNVSIGSDTFINWKYVPSFWISRFL